MDCYSLVLGLISALALPGLISPQWLCSRAPILVLVLVLLALVKPWNRCSLVPGLISAMALPGLIVLNGFLVIVVVVVSSKGLQWSGTILVEQNGFNGLLCINIVPDHCKSCNSIVGGLISTMALPRSNCCSPSPPLNLVTCCFPCLS